MLKWVEGVLLCGLIVHSMAGAETFTLDEASGVYWDGSAFWIVDDDERAVFRMEDAGDASSATPIALRDSEMKQYALLGRAHDLEGVAILADGRVVALSEDTRALIRVGEDENEPKASGAGVVAQYPEAFAERMNWGLEGLAVDHRADGSTRIAVAWEGGYVFGDYHPPRVIVHELGVGETVRFEEDDAIDAVALQIRVEPDVERRFRVPDLVWDTTDAGAPMGSALIALLSPVEPPRGGGHRWKGKVLQRFDEGGEPVGKPFPLEAPLRAMGLDDVLNWEGLAWFEPGKSLVMVAEDVGRASWLAVVDVSAWE